MSYNDDSLIVVNSILQPLAPNNSQFPYLFFNNKNCLGKRYPSEGEFGLWNQDLSRELVGFDNIVSLYVPPHAILEMWSTGDGDGYCAIQGPNIISNTGAYVTFWRHYDDSPCFPTEIHCGKRVGSNNGWRFGIDFARIRITWNTSWVTMLHDLASNKQPLTFGGIQYNVDNDALFNQICPHPYDRFSCNCHSAYQLILKNHFDAAESSYVNLLQNGCNPNTMYVPSKANVGSVSSQECTAQINAQLNTGTFPTIDNGGSTFYICAGKTYVNGFKDPNSDPTNKNSLELEPDNESNTIPIIIGVVVSVLLIVVIVWFTAKHQNTTSKSKSKSIHRRRMQAL